MKITRTSPIIAATKPAAGSVARVRYDQLGASFPVLLLLLLPVPTWGECLQLMRTMKYAACPADRANFNDITSTRRVPSTTHCGRLCVEDATCTSFNIIKDDNAELECQLSNFQLTNCSTLSDKTGGRSYAAKTKRHSCTDQWRVALKTVGSKVVKGSVHDLREAIESGSTVNVLRERYPSSELYKYSGELYVLDSVRIQNFEFEPQVIGSVYTYSVTMDSDGALWTHVTFDTFGNTKTSWSNGLGNDFTNESITWLVQGVTSECFQGQALSHGEAVKVPALTVDGAQKSGEVSDTISVLERGSTMRFVSYMGNDLLAYPTYDVTIRSDRSAVYSTSPWIPGHSNLHMPLRVHRFDLSAQGIEMFIEFDSANGSYSQGFAKDPALTKTSLFLHACWELQLSVTGNNIVEQGSKDSLISAIQSGARLLISHNNGSVERVVEVEEIRLYVGGFFIATSKMGVSSDNGYNWESIQANSEGILEIGYRLIEDWGPRHFFTDKRERPYRFTWRSFNEIEGTWMETRERLMAGLIPRAMIRLSEYESLYLDIEFADVASDVSYTVLQSQRVPEAGGFKVYYIQLDGYWRADIGLYRSYGWDIIQQWTQFYAYTLFFEDWPQSSD